MEKLVRFRWLNLRKCLSETRKLVKRFIPEGLLKWYGIRRRNAIISRFRHMSTQAIFTEIFENNYWNSSESISGTGSEIKQTESLINDLSKLLIDLKITSVLDLPCGDFNWMQKVDLSNIDYIGGDIVEELITGNITKYREKTNLKFKVINLITDPLPQSDLIIVRDCLVHLSYKDIFDCIKNMKASGSKYLLTTTFTNYHQNHDIVTGSWRPLNLQEDPFNFSAPLFVINENCTEGDGIYRDKSMALWNINRI